jgi:molybdopterin molybdotransferase
MGGAKDPDADRMLPVDEALARVLAQAWALPVETVSLTHALGRVLAEDVHADADVPPFAKSAVDGFACRRAELPGPLHVAGEIPAGTCLTEPLPAGACLRIMTGAPVPPGADCVVMQERAIMEGADHVRFEGDLAAGNITPQGEDLRTGDRVLARGTRLGPQHLGALAMAGCTEPCVAQLPRVAVLATGSELVPPEETPPPGKIRNSNSTQLVALLTSLGIPVTRTAIVPDTPGALHDALAQALAANDVVISTGGVSVGKYDLVPQIAAALGLTPCVRRVAMQPGKPILFAAGEGHALFGLSGNPVSSYLQFLLFVAPFLARLMGSEQPVRILRAVLGEPCTRAKADRMKWLPVRLDAQGGVVPVPFHGSAHLHALMHADGWIAFPVGVAELPVGQLVDVRLL